MLVSNKKWKRKKDYVEHDTPPFIIQKMHNIFAWIIKFNVLFFFPFFVYNFTMQHHQVSSPKKLTFMNDMLVEKIPNYKKLVK